MNRILPYIFLIAVLTSSVSITKAQIGFDPNLFFGKEEITIVVTDSGLGGLSVMDDIAKKLKTSGCFKKVSLIFVNALFDANTGYNTLQTRQEKITIFSNVLTSIEKRFKPDAILIACNTLSVIYKETDFVKQSKTPVIGIVESGVKLMAEKLKSDNNSNVIIFGTETTIEEGSHKKALLALKIADERIITKSCPQLQSYIEQNPAGEETEMLITVYLNEALEQLPEKNGNIYLSLNCSHFGYSYNLWKKAFANTPYKSGEILDPNSIMGDFLVDKKYRNRNSGTEISFLVVSKVKLLNENAIVSIFSEKTPELASAIQNYHLMPDLFN